MVSSNSSDALWSLSIRKKRLMDAKLRQKILPLLGGHRRLEQIPTKLMWQCNALTLGCGMKNLHIILWRFKYYKSFHCPLNLVYNFNMDCCVHMIELEGIVNTSWISLKGFMCSVNRKVPKLCPLFIGLELKDFDGILMQTCN
jgi:hypothetical protein